MADESADPAREKPPIRLERMFAALADPERGHEIDYNRWYEREHIIAGRVRHPNRFAQQRWVATSELKDLRITDSTSPSEGLRAGSLLATSWLLKDWPPETSGWGEAQPRWLDDHDTSFDARTLVLVRHHVLTRTVARDPDPVPIELALDHGYGGLVVVVIEPSPAAPGAEVEAFLHDQARGLCAGPVAAISTWLPDGAAVVASEPWESDAAVPESHNGPWWQMCFVDDDPRQAWSAISDHASSIADSHLASVRVAAPFFAAVPGTDRYMNELW